MGQFEQRVFAKQALSNARGALRKIARGLRPAALSAPCQRTSVLRFRDGGRSRLPAHATDDKTQRRPATLALGWGPNANTKDDKPKRRFVGLPSAAAARKPSALVGRHRRPRCGPSSVQCSRGPTAARAAPRLGTPTRLPRWDPALRSSQQPQALRGRRAVFPGVATGIAARIPSAQTDPLPSHEPVLW